MRKVELPVETPLLTTHMTNASMEIIFRQNPTFDNWYYNNAIQWICLRDIMSGFSSPILIMNTCQINNLENLAHIIHFPISFIRHCPNEIIKSALELGYYVYFRDVDDFYVKGKSWYKERHFWHPGLISGYDDVDNTFTVTAYDERWIFSTFKIPQICISEGLEAVCATFRCSENFSAIKIKDDIHKLNVRLIRDHLRDYLTYVSSPNVYGTFMRPTGMSVYGYLQLYLDKLSDESISHEKIDKRIFRLILDHKKLMYLRIKAVEDHLQWDHSISDAYQPLEQLANKAHFLYAKHCRKPKKTILQFLKEALSEIHEQEENILKQLVEKIGEAIKE